MLLADNNIGWLLYAEQWNTKWAEEEIGSPSSKQWDPGGRTFVFYDKWNKKNMVDVNLEDMVLLRCVLLGYKIMGNQVS